MIVPYGYSMALCNNKKYWALYYRDFALWALSSRALIIPSPAQRKQRVA